MRILNRVLTFVVGKSPDDDVLYYEPDERHVQLLMQDYKLKSGSKAKATPLDKASFLARHPLVGPELDDGPARVYRSACMRLGYLVLDRPEAQFAFKELSRAMAKPTVHAEEHLKSVIRFLAGAPRVVWRYPRQEMQTKLMARTDSNWAGCPITRRSTTCTHLNIGQHPIFAGSSTQIVIGLSSGESEFYGAVRSACRALGLASLAQDIGWTLSPHLVTDSSAAKGMASRRGAGSVRHIHCPALWLQQVISNRRMVIERRAGATLSADIGTKTGFSASKLWELLALFGCVRATGRSTAQLSLTGQ